MVNIHNTAMIDVYYHDESSASILAGKLSQKGGTLLEIAKHAGKITVQPANAAAAHEITAFLANEAERVERPTVKTFGHMSRPPSPAKERKVFWPYATSKY